MSAPVQRLQRMGLGMDEFQERLVRGSAGPGGQNVNKVATCVHLAHLPSGLAVKAMSARTQARNRALAWERLLDLLEERARAAAAGARDTAERDRRRHRRKPARVRRAMVDDKRRTASRKSLRRPPGAAD